MIAIDTIEVENEVAGNMDERSELDYWIYYSLLEYVDSDFERSPGNLS